ncbi:MAG: hypothetical protein AAB484_01960 [Patescibacteria group bacterium]
MLEHLSHDRLLIGLSECDRMLALPLSPIVVAEWKMRQRNVRQALMAFDFLKRTAEEPVDTQSRNVAILKFLDSDEAEEFQRTHD